MRIRDLLNKANEVLLSSSDTPRLDAEVMLASVLGVSRLKLITEMSEEVSCPNEVRFEDLLARRMKSEPLAYILGYKEFFDYRFLVNPSVLIPRPETEMLVEKVLEEEERKRLLRVDLVPSDDEAQLFQVLDLGTGSGCIAISIAAELKKKGTKCLVVSVDNSNSALTVARNNANILGVIDNVQFYEGRWYSALPHANQKFDVIVSNPPYVSRELKGLPKDLSYEPSSALYADDDGLKEVKTLVEGAGNFLKNDGVFLCEIGSEQREELEKFIEERLVNSSCWHRKPRFHKDLSGKDRVLELSPC